jgi:quercetin dioxygenase-like cupin family protein
MVRQIKSGDEVLAVCVGGDWKEGLQFFSDDRDFIQVGTWRYPAGQRLKAHKHNRVERAITHTQEAVYVRKGALKAIVYDQAGRAVEEIVVREGDLLIMLRGGHGYEIIEDDTQVLEVKNGPYPGPEADRTRL